MIKLMNRPRFHPAYLALLIAIAALGGCAPKPVTGWNSSPETTAGPAIAAPDTVSLRLAEAAEKAASSLDSIARIEGNKAVEGGGMNAPLAGSPTGISSGAPTNLTSPPQSMLPIGGMGGIDNASYAIAPPRGINAQPQQSTAGAPPELTAPVTIKWYGPVETLLAKLGNRAGYAFKAEGAAPPVPLTVNLDVYNQPLIEVIKSTSLQVAGKADVELDAGSQTLSLRYAPVDAGSY